MSKRPAKQSDVAESLKLSRAAVTRVLNDDPDFRVTPETRSRILRRARELGYRPRQRRTGNIGYLVCGGLGPPEQAIYHELAQVASRADYRAFLVHKPALPLMVELKRVLNPLAAEGVVVSGDCSAVVLENLAGIMPTVLLDVRPTQARVDRVCTDPALATARLTHLLLEHGHRRIALIVHTVAPLSGAAQVEGYRRALDGAGIAFDPSLVAEKSNVQCLDLLRALLACAPRPTALLACTVGDHSEILSLVKTLGCRVPEDMSSAGLCIPDHPTSRARLHGDICCIGSLYAQMARACMDRLIRRIRDHALPTETITVPLEVHAGNTVARVAGSDGMSVIGDR